MSIQTKEEKFWAYMGLVYDKCLSEAPHENKVSVDLIYDTALESFFVFDDAADDLIDYPFLNQEEFFDILEHQLKLLDTKEIRATSTLMGYDNNGMFLMFRLWLISLGKQTVWSVLNDNRAFENILLQKQKIWIDPGNSDEQHSSFLKLYFGKYRPLTSMHEISYRYPRYELRELMQFAQKKYPRLYKEQREIRKGNNGKVILFMSALALIIALIIVAFNT